MCSRRLCACRQRLRQQEPSPPGDVRQEGGCMCDVKPAQMAFQAEMAGLTVLQFDRLLLGLAVYFFGAVI